jgi:hypothetical protein
MTMSFYSPYMKGPDFASGIGDISSQIMQMLMMKKMFPDGKSPAGATPLPQRGGQGMMGQAPPMPSGQMQDRPGFGPGAGAMGMAGGPGGLEGAGTTGLDSDMLKKILAALSGAGGGMGGF